jgi:hypothetical protein
MTESQKTAVVLFILLALLLGAVTIAYRDVMQLFSPDTQRPTPSEQRVTSEDPADGTDTDSQLDESQRKAEP